MARAGYCRHGSYVGHGENHIPCLECERERRERQETELARVEEIRRIAREEIAAYFQSGNSQLDR